MRIVAKLIALAILAASIATPARAQVPEQQGFFGNIDGRWMWLGGDRVSVPGASADVTNGPGGQMLIGYKLDPHWDVALAGDVQGLLSHLTKLQQRHALGRHQPPAFRSRARLQRRLVAREWRPARHPLRQGAAYSIAPVAGFDQREMYGIGPKIGVGVRLPISENWGVIGGADAALLYTSFNEIGGGVLLSNTSYWQFVPQLSAELGVSWRSSNSPSFSFSTGARIATSFNTAITADGTHQGTLLEFGPFIRMAYNFAGPSRSARLAVKEEREIWTNSPPTGSRRYVAYFGFERSTLGLVAASVVRQAAEDIKGGRPATIAIAAADRDDGSNFSRALSLRRADAIREALIRDGVSPTQIDIGTAADAPQVTPLAASIGMPQSRARISY